MLVSSRTWTAPCREDVLGVAAARCFVKKVWVKLATIGLGMHAVFNIEHSVTSEKNKRPTGGYQ